MGLIGIRGSGFAMMGLIVLDRQKAGLNRDTIFYVVRNINAVHWVI